MGKGFGFRPTIASGWLTADSQFWISVPPARRESYNFMYDPISARPGRGESYNFMYDPNSSNSGSLDNRRAALKLQG